jgi:sugar transferase (PEP-CTERM/EpsH1 system associated)
VALIVDDRPLIAHIVYRFDTGGLENGVVNLINNMPVNDYRHVIISLTDITDFKKRIFRDDVEFYALHKRPGQIFQIYPQLISVFRRLRPKIVHTRNLAALEVLVPAWISGVRVRVHGEHGRDVGDLNGDNRKFQWIRRFYSFFVTHYLALSRDLNDYLVGKIGISQGRITQVYNGVDFSRFSPQSDNSDELVPDCPFAPSVYWTIGTVGRMQVVKDQPTLARAFVRAMEIAPELKVHVRLVMVGDGVLREQCLAILSEARLSELAWLPGARDDVPSLMRCFKCFVLPSLAEGISNTVLEAMATGLPVIATDVGGNQDLVADGVTGVLVSVGDVEGIAQQLVRFARSPEMAFDMGRAGRQVVEDKFSLQAMVNTYQGLYDSLLAQDAGVAKSTSITR